MRVIFTFFFFVFYFSTNSQSILITPADTTANIPTADLSDNWLLFSPRVSLTNTTDDTLNIVWRREFIGECPLAWDFLVSDLWNDYTPHINTNYDPSISLEAAFPLLPNQTEEAIHSHLYPRTVAGCCNVAIHISELNNPDSILATAYFNYRINDPDCSLVNDIEEIKKEILIYPNPADNVVYIETEKPIQSIQVFDLNGKKLKTEINNNQIKVDDLPNGILIFKLVMKNGQLFFQKLNKTS